MASPKACSNNTVNIDRDDSGAVIASHLEALLKCDDDWLRPVNMAFGPDGCLDIADWYNNDTTSSTAFDRLTIGLVPSLNAGPFLVSITEAGGNLVFSRESTSGQNYDLLSSTDLSTDPSPWAAYHDGVTTLENIAASLTEIPSPVKSASLSF